MVGFQMVPELLVSVPITQEAFTKLRSLSPKRIRHKDHPVLNPGNPQKGFTSFINIPFKETIDPILHARFPDYNSFEKGGKYWYGITNEEQTKKFEDFLNLYKRTVFIRSLLPCMVAIDMNLDGPEGDYTEVGRHEHKAKEDQSRESGIFLQEKLSNFISNMSFYQDADGIVSVPSSTGKDFCLPLLMAQSLARVMEIEDYTETIRFENKTRSLQEENIAKKWEVLSNSNLVVNQNGARDMSGKTLILLDDLYQSGTTMHYVAMRLQEAGVKHILGLVMVKARRDDDNRDKTSC